MKKRLCMSQVVALVVIALFLMPAVLAAETKAVEYTIKKGDTLWTISSGHLKNPKLWPRLWKANTNVRNPNLIYPNQVIIIPGSLMKDDARVGKKLVPVKARLLTAADRKPIVSKDIILDSGYFMRSFVPLGKIASRFPEEQTLFGNNSIVHIIATTKLIPDTKFYIVDMAEPIYSPVEKTDIFNNPVGKKEIVGYLVRIKGMLQITGEENGNTMAVIRELYKEIRVDDLIMSYYPLITPYEPVIERTPLLSGMIVAVGDKRTPGGRNDVVYLNKGSLQGIEIGDKFKISSGAEPHAIIGSLQVFSVFDDTAVAIIKKSEREVIPEDTFGN
jgi:LysM repeat protein